MKGQLKFYSRVNLPKTIPNPTGSEFDKKYVEKIQKDGVKTLVEAGETNRYEKIQKSLPETLTYNIIKRFQEGDEEAFSKINSVYADITNAPTSLMDAFQKINDIENQFNELPVAVKALFNHSSSEFIASMATGEGIEILKNYSSKYENQPDSTTNPAPEPETPSDSKGE